MAECSTRECLYDKFLKLFYMPLFNKLSASVAQRIACQHEPD